MDNNPANDPADNPTGSVDPADQQGSGDPSPPSQTNDEATRRLQSERDKTRAENEKLSERLSQMEGHVYGQQAERVMKDFLSDNKDKYPDVEVDDLLTAETPKELEEVAKKAQGKYDRIRNDALQRVQEVPEETMTEEERQKAEEDLEKEVAKDGRSGFQKFLQIRQTKTRK